MRWTGKDIVDYYKTNTFAYWLYGRNMHYGYWTDKTVTLRQATQKFNDILIEKARISRNDVVLDAGCGVGGASIYLAKTLGCRAIGITLCRHQVDLAYKNAEKAGVSHLVDFYEMDYLHTAFRDRTFSVVWGFESICYAQSKLMFAQEAFRLLKEGGRMIVADGFSSRQHYEGRDKRLMQRWLDGWIVNSLDTPADWKGHAEKAGFVRSDYTDVTPQVMPTARLLYMVSMPFIFLHWIDKFIPLKPYPTDACYNQYHALKRGLWEYGVFYAEKAQQFSV
jgi:tocopherol O-methyltransferase